MSRHLPGWIIVDRVTTSTDTALVAATGVSSVNRGLVPQRETMTIAFAISVAAANDFGSAKICDLPTGNLIIIGCFVDLTCSQAGFTSNASTSLTAAVGTVATTSTNFANAGEKNVIATVTGVGAGTTGTVKGATTNTEKLLFLASGAKALYLNIADAVTAATGTETIAGTVELVFINLSGPA
jgi:hypothetical protein